MIKINPARLRLAEKEYFSLINEKKKDGTYRQYSLIKKIEAKIEACQNQNHLAFWKHLLSGDNYSFLHRLLTSEIDKLEEINENIKMEFQQNLNDTDFKTEILDTFGYDEFRKKKCKELIERLDIKVCPYCNENYTSTTVIEDKKGKKDVRLEFDFDHFIDKAVHPYLSLSLHNLVPSCKICNSSYKTTKEFKQDTHIHPYKEGFDEDCKFEVKINDVGFLYGNIDSISLELKVKESSKPEKKERITKNIEALKLKERYQNHKDYALELLHKNIVYNEDYINSLYKQYEGTLFKNREDVLRMITSNFIEDEELGKRPLAKLTRDIVEGMDLL